MSTEEIRLECLKLAAKDGIDPIALAKRMESYVTGRDTVEAEGKLALVREVVA
jgi:hypothetical protein